jgi:hypothetical protein
VIARNVGVSMVWLQKYVKEKYQEQPECLHVQKKSWKIRRSRRTMGCGATHPVFLEKSNELKRNLVSLG